MFISKVLLSFVAIFVVANSSISLVTGTESVDAAIEIEALEDPEPEGEEADRDLVVSYPGDLYGPVGRVKVVVKHDKYPRETYWRLSKDLDVYAEQKKNSVKTPYKLVSKTVYLPAGRYGFRIWDAAGDGICCEYGSGYWEIYVDYGYGPKVLLYRSEGNFAGKEQIFFVLS
jgi:hypothetical protein